jgi:hypothetical protein
LSVLRKQTKEEFVGGYQARADKSWAYYPSYNEILSVDFTSERTAVARTELLLPQGTVLIVSEELEAVVQKDLHVLPVSRVAGHPGTPERPPQRLRVPPPCTSQSH